MGVYDRPRESAKRIIAAKGELCSWQQTVIVENPDKPWETMPGVPVVYTGIRIAFLPASETQLKTLTLKLKTEISITTEIGYMGSVKFEPKLNDLIIRKNGQKMRIIDTGEINPNGEGSVLYQLAVQK